MASNSQYRYSTLKANEIRLVDILPSFKGKNELRCKIRHVSLDSHPVFEALSYAWGDSTALESIFCTNDNTKSAKFTLLTITKTLHEALTTRRGRLSATLIWADQISIDQTNIPERNSQVEVMSRIYSQAKSVKIWLGPKHPDDKLVLSCLKELFIKDFAQRGSDPSTHMFFPKIKDSGWKALENFFNRPWFSRTWILQEAVLANDGVFIFGDIMWPWKLMLSALVSIQVFWQTSKFSVPPAGLASLKTILILRQIREGNVSKSMNILDLANFARGQDATDSRDKIFAVLGLSPQKLDIENLIPDYTRTTADIYTAVALHSLTTHKDLRFLSMTCPTTTVTTTNETTTQLPSWVPNWSLKPATEPRLPSYHFSAGTTLSPQYTVSPDTLHLTLKGYRIGAFHTINPPLSPISTTTLTSTISAYEKSRTQITTAHTLVLTTPIIYPNNEPRSLAFARAITCDTNNLGKQVTVKDLEPFETMMKIYAHPFSVAERITSNAAWRVVATFESGFVAKSLGRRFCLLDDGLHFGWVPPHTDETKGDFVVLFAGSADLHVLRPVELHESGGKICYQVVGFAYIHGMMHGEYLTRSNLQAQEFCLV